VTGWALPAWAIEHAQSLAALAGICASTGGGYELVESYEPRDDADPMVRAGLRTVADTRSGRATHAVGTRGP